MKSNLATNLRPAQRPFLDQPESASCYVHVPDMYHADRARRPRTPVFDGAADGERRWPRRSSRVPMVSMNVVTDPAAASPRPVRCCSTRTSWRRGWGSRNGWCSGWSRYAGSARSAISESAPCLRRPTQLVTPQPPHPTLKSEEPECRPQEFASPSSPSPAISGSPAGRSGGRGRRRRVRGVEATGRWVCSDRGRVDRGSRRAA